ncbi:hypothetical protein [Paenibacillus sp. IHBB 10380]|uniref:hypothetical protein n=1 Tax=Paenibacillus sp. IHBB 10380 TaxID=1566358 RepID=UPI0006987F69|nr:hypothetical protein [Paenibacillus sp. IHBB 10380]
MKEDKKKYIGVTITILSVLLILGPSLFFGFIGKPAEMGVALAAGALAAAFLNLDKLQKFKGAGIEFELKQAVKEAQATIENLKEFTDPLFVSSIKIMSVGMTWDGIPENIQHDIVRKIEKITDGNNVSVDVTNAIKDFYDYNFIQLFNRLISGIEGYYKPEVSKQLSLLMDAEKSIFPSGKQVDQVLSELPHITPELEDLIKDYAFYKENRYPRSRS